MANKQRTNLERAIVVIEQTLRAMIQIDLCRRTTARRTTSIQSAYPFDETTPENSECCHGAYIGRPSTTNPDYRVCAERLTHAVN